VLSPVIAAARAGSGTTLAYVIPAVIAVPVFGVVVFGSWRAVGRMTQTCSAKKARLIRAGFIAAWCVFAVVLITSAVDAARH
jgi:hypothetical protein